MPPSRIAGRYELQDQLGEGGMGVVWRALDVKTGGYVAIKLMKDNSDPVAVELFTKEWRALAEMCHPNIVDVRDVDIIEENRQKKPFFVMPLLRGTTLADLISNASARLTPERVVEITTQVCKGLQAAHQRGLVHRDLKPSNIFVMDDDTAKIIDFGVVHLAGSKSVTGQKGTFQYMSPEQAQLGEITPASDLFSMGVILYEALTRRKPFARSTADETMEAVTKFIPPPVSEINPSINQSVSRVVHKCLAKKAIHRFSSARELSETLQKAFRNEPVFDSAKIEPRIERAKAAFKAGDEAFASDILAELEAEGNLDPRITVLRMQIDTVVKQKKIRQLLESARARMEQDEIPLALDKLREVLELDPENPDALAMRETMEKQRNETQIAKWLELAHAHLENCDFGAARHAAQEVLAIRSAETRALDLLEKIDSTEADAKRIREQKEQLYSSALRAYQNGEIEGALSKLERLFSVARANPDAAVPERDAVYQSFYKEVRSERESIRSALEDAQRQFSEKNFAGAMAICLQLLTKYPNDGTFQALKIRIEDAERQELSSYVAEVSKRVESEPDLDRRASVLREACERYPDDPQFRQQLKLVRERRDFVNSIVAKAQQYEERGQYPEAIGQWEILRNIHPQYPGIAFELDECKKKRDRQAREEEHSRLVEEIDGLMERRAYAKAIECADAALQEFTGDAELSGLRTLAEQGLERTKESRRFFEEGQRALEAKDFTTAGDLLRRSFDLDPRAPGLRDALVNVLAERARTLMDENWRDAEPLYQEAGELDASHPAVRALRSSIAEAKRQTLVGQCLTECRALVAAGKAQDAAERIRAVRAEYPHDPRLEQYEATLQKEANEIRRREERGRDRVLLGENRRVLEQNPDRAKLRAVLEQSCAIRAKYPDDPEIGQTVAEIELGIKRVAKVDDLSMLLSVETARTGTDDGPMIPRRGTPRIKEKKGPKLVDQNAAKTKVFDVKDRGSKESTLQVPVWKLRTFADQAGQKVVALVRPAGKWSTARLGVLAGALVLLGMIGYLVVRPPRPGPVVERHPVRTVQIVADPQDSIVTSDGKAISDGAAKLGSTVEVSHLGYKTKQVLLNQESDARITLEAEPVRISIQTSESEGTVLLDGAKIGDLSDGSMSGHELNPDGTNHNLSVLAKGRKLFSVQLEGLPGTPPRVTSLNTSNSFALTTLGNRATLYGGRPLNNVRVGDQNIAVSPSGANIVLSEQNHEMLFDVRGEQASVPIEISNAPALVLRALDAPGQALITTNVEAAELTVDKVIVPRRKNGSGWIVTKPDGSTHDFALSANGYQPHSWKMTIERRKTVPWHVELKPLTAPTVLVAFVVSGGTPGATVQLDNKRIGQLDANGDFTFPNAVEGGRHTAVFSKPGYLDRTVEFPVNPPSEARVNSPVLTRSTATVAFQIAVKGATMKYRRTGDPQYKDANPYERLSLPAGLYEFMFEAPGYEPTPIKETIGTDNSTIPVRLMPKPDFEFQDPGQINHEGGWVKAKNAGKFVVLKQGHLREAIVFAPPGKKTLFWDKKVEWFVEDSAARARTRYVLEGKSGKLNRRLTLGQDASNASDTKVDAQSVANDGSLSVHIRVDGARVRVTNDRGILLDDFTAPGQDFSNGRICIKTDSPFIVRSDN